MRKFRVGGGFTRKCGRDAPRHGSKHACHGVPSPHFLGRFGVYLAIGNAEFGMRKFRVGGGFTRKCGRDAPRHGSEHACHGVPSPHFSGRDSVFT